MQYPTKMHLMAFESSFFLSSFGTWVKALEPKNLKLLNVGLRPNKASNGVLKSRLFVGHLFFKYIVIFIASSQKLYTGSYLLTCFEHTPQVFCFSSLQPCSIDECGVLWTAELSHGPCNIWWNHPSHILPLDPRREFWWIFLFVFQSCFWTL